MFSESSIRNQIVEVGRKLAAKGLVAATDGNISFRIDTNKIVITPSGVHKGDLAVDDLILIDLDGKKLSGRGEPSTETPMHTMVYKERGDVKAVIHAHPPCATALSVAGVTLAACVIPEVVITMGAIPTSEYATPCTEEGAEVIKELVRESDAIILDRHGSLTIGENLEAAYFKLEKLEHAAHVTMMARLLGKIRVLSDEEVAKLVRLRERLGIKNRTMPCEFCSACPRGSQRPYEGTGKVDQETLINIVSDEILKKLAR